MSTQTENHPGDGTQRRRAGRGCEVFYSKTRTAPSRLALVADRRGDRIASQRFGSISTAARLPTFLSDDSRPRSSPGLSSENTFFICPECFRKAETMRSLPRGVRATIRTRRFSALSTRLTKPFATRRSTAILIEPGVRSTIGPIVLTGKGPLCSRTSSTAKSDRPARSLQYLRLRTSSGRALPSSLPARRRPSLDCLGS